MKIALGTTSELKIRAVKAALSKLKIDADIFPVETTSEVSAQPIGMEEIARGAIARAKNALRIGESDIGLGIENGIIKDEKFDRWLEIPIIVAMTKDGTQSFSYGAAYPVPDWAIEDIKKNNSELGFFIKKLDPTVEKDPIKYFSDDTIKREEILSEAIACALIEILQSAKYRKPEGI